MSQNKYGGAVSGEKASIKLLTGYGLGEVACQMSWYMINNYLNIFYTDVVGLSGAAISAIVLIARIWDAINDPMMGQIADRTNTRWGRFRPYLFFAPPFLAIFNILTFTVFPIQGLPKIILCGACYIGAGMAYTACSIAYQALLNVIQPAVQALPSLALSCRWLPCRSSFTSARQSTKPVKRWQTVTAILSLP